MHFFSTCHMLASFAYEIFLLYFIEVYISVAYHKNCLPCELYAWVYFQHVYLWKFVKRHGLNISTLTDGSIKLNPLFILQLVGLYHSFDLKKEKLPAYIKNFINKIHPNNNLQSQTIFLYFQVNFRNKESRWHFHTIYQFSSIKIFLLFIPGSTYINISTFKKTSHLI